MAVGDTTLYSIIAPPEASADDVSKLAVEVYLDEAHPPESIIPEPLGRDPQGNSVWVITVREGAEKPQEASGADEEGKVDTDTLFGNGGP